MEKKSRNDLFWQWNIYWNSEKDRQDTTEQSAILTDELILESTKVQAQPNNTVIPKDITGKKRFC